MKRYQIILLPVIIAIVAFMLATVGHNPSEAAAPSDQPKLREATVERITYKGHHYLNFHPTILHDPDCPCH